jgi:acyl-CoA thioesterase I
MIRWQPFVCLMLAALVPTAAYARTPTRVSCVGVSITVGVGATSGPKSYPAVLQTMLGSGVMVQNFGVSGATMLSNGDKPYENEYQYYAVTKFVNEAPADAVMDIVIMFGANDSKPQNWTPAGMPKQDAQYVADYKLMIQKFQAAPVKPLI